MADLQAVFEQLREAVRPYGERLVVTDDAPTSYMLRTGHVRADGYPTPFGGVQLRPLRQVVLQLHPRRRRAPSPSSPS